MERMRSARKLSSARKYTAVDMMVEEQKAKLAEVFQGLDVDGNGRLTVGELSTALQSMGILEEELPIFLEKLDTHHSGDLDLEEFMSITEELLNFERSKTDAFVNIDEDALAAMELRRTLLAAVALLVVYLCVGYIYGSRRQGWSVIDSMYFVIVTLTTVGYGDNSFASGTNADKIFGCFYVFFGVAFISSAVGIILDALSQRANDKMNQLVATSTEAVAEGDKPKFDLQHEKQKLYMAIARSSLQILLTVCIGAACMMHLEADAAWSFADGIYFSCISMTTVGYGDLLPTTDEGKLFTIVYILFAFGIVATAMSQLAALPFEMRRLVHIDKILNQFGDSLDAKELDALCESDEIKQLRNELQVKKASAENPHVSRAEFVLWQLMKQGKISFDDDVSPCLGMFDKLDYDLSGSVNREDIYKFCHDRFISSAMGNRSMSGKPASSASETKQAPVDPQQSEEVAALLPAPVPSRSSATRPTALPSPTRDLDELQACVALWRAAFPHGATVQSHIDLERSSDLSAPFLGAPRG